MPSELQRPSRPKDLDLATPPITRNTSFSSDKPSLTRFASITSPPPTASPEPAYIAVSAASQIITSDHENHQQMWFDEDGIEPSGETVRVTPSSLRRVNIFLDYLLHRFLAVAKSTKLSSLKLAVAEVLNRRLAKEAVAGADQELLEYMGGPNEDYAAYWNGQDPAGDWDLELAWKRTRLRCMVYSSLGDMEEEDEKVYAERDNLDSPTDAEESGLVSPAVAIFLTSILEFLGEQALIVAGQAAYHRLRAERIHKKVAGDVSSTDAVRDSIVSFDPSNEIAERITVDDLDIEKVAADASLGRLWRTWKKTVRTRSGSFARTMSSESATAAGHRKRQSIGTASTRSRRSSIDDAEGPARTQQSPANLDEVREEEILPHMIPLPLSENDIDEIEVPGLAAEIDSDTETLHGDTDKSIKRSRSLIDVRGAQPIDVAALQAPSPQTPTATTTLTVPSTVPAKRSRSVPPAERQPFTLPLVAKDSHSSKDEGEVIEEKKVEPANEAEPKADTSAPAKEVDPEPSTVTEKENIIKDITDAKKGETKSNTGMIASVAAGAAAIGTAALATIVPIKKHEEKKADGKKVDDEKAVKGTTPVIKEVQRDYLEVASKPDFDTDRLGDESDIEVEALEEAEIVETTRLSMDGSRAPEIVETRSRAPSSAKSVAVPVEVTTDRMPNDSVHAVARKQSEDNDLNAIGVARTSNMTVPAVALSSPQTESRRSTPDKDRLTYQERKSGASSAEEDEGVPAKAKPAFVLAAAPASRIARQQPGTAAKGVNENLAPAPTSNSLAPMSRTPGAEHGVPPLTPLREMMEAAHDTSDEASSIAPSHSASGSEHSVTSLTRPMLPHHGHEQSISSVYSQHAQQASISSSKYSDVKAQQAPTTPYLPPDRAAVQRVFTPPVTPGEPKVQRSDSVGKNQRQIHTSGSNTSQVSNKLKGLIGLPHESTEKSASQLRTSEEADDKRSDENFEKLIQSGETLQYTLTPQTVRETEATQPVTKVHIHPAVTEDAPKAREPTPPGSRETPTGVKELSQEENKTNIHRSHPSFSRPAVPAVQSQPPPVPSKPYIPRSTPAPPSKRTKSLRPGMPEAREARPVSHSTRDIADFLRATGPDGTAPIAQANGGPRPVASSRSLARSTSSANRAGTISPDITRTFSRTSSKTNRQRLQAREATVPYGETSSELADFIRQGPPNSLPSGSRPPAPVSAAASMRSRPGASSSSGVAGNAERAPPVAKFDGPPETKRKQHRNKDPYAIDFSDEEEDFEPQKTVERQESLADFLSSTTPPSNSQPQSLSNSAAAAQIMKAAQQKKASSNRTASSSPAPADRSGFKSATRSNGAAPSPLPPRAGGRINPSAAPTPTRVPAAAPQLSLSPDGASTLFGDSGSLGMDNYKLQSRGSDRMAMSPTSKLAGPPMLAKDAQTDPGNLDQVADFLRSAGPPVSSSTYVPPAKPTGGLSKFFRRQKV